MNDDDFVADYFVDDAMGVTAPAHMQSTSVSVSFDAWVQLTEAFAEQMRLLETGTASARPEAIRLGQLLEQINHELHVDKQLGLPSRIDPTWSSTPAPLR
ncbi:hypothetical protein BH11PSE13_BH11PSE13_29510 [soil metagenome]